MDEPLISKIALSLIPGIGGVLARNLIAYVGNVEGIVKEPKKSLLKIPGIGEVNADRIINSNVLARAEKELAFIEKNNISAHFFLDENYPRRLLNCADGPILFYSKGHVNFNETKMVSIVGTRNATDYGKNLCDELIKNLAERNHHTVIVSGLAYGIDIQAHKSALKYNLPTIAVFGHGLDLVYPSLHKTIALQMVENGALVSDFPSETKIDPPNFIRRNRIIAGLTDATIVVESGQKGGSLVTADIAASYNRDVYAFPGNVGAAYSKGCNKLIKRNVAALIEGIDDLEYLMGWEKTRKKPVGIQQSLFVNLSDEENSIIDLLKQNNRMFIDQICSESKLPMSKVSGILMNLEFKNIVIALPGKMYKLK